MRKFKKSLLAMLCVSILVSMIPMVSLAASAQLRFSDPETSAGSMVEVTATFTSDTGISDAKATLSYDANYLEFVSGTGVSGGNGELQLTATGDGATTQISWNIQFNALAEGTTVVEVLTATGTAANGISIQVTKGQSTITIGPGTGMPVETATSAPGGTVSVNGKNYTIENNFDDILIPVGFEKTEMQFEGQTCTATIQAASGIYAMYLTGEDGLSNFFLYDPDNGSFTPMEQIVISDVLDSEDERYIILLNEDVSSKLSDQYQITNLTIGENQFPAWQKAGDTDYYLVYALNSDGKKAFYQYDVTDKTFQKNIPEEKTEEEPKESIVGNIMNKFGKLADYAAIAVAVIIFIMFLTLIVKSVQLRNRDDELDEYYDRYGELPDEEPVKPQKKQKQKEKPKKESKKKKKYEEDLFEEDLDEDIEDFGMTDEISLEWDEDDYEEDFSEYETKAFEDFDSALDRLPEQKRVSHAEEDDTFKMDIIDLD